MGRSLFIVNSRNTDAVRAQFRRFSKDFKGTGLSVEGPFSDRRLSVESIAEHVRKRMHFCKINRPAETVVSTVAPQNMRTSFRSWLEVPFILDELGLEPFPVGCAGDIPLIEPVDYKSAAAIPASLQDLNLLAVSVMRRLGVPTHYAYLHYDEGICPATLRQQVSSFSGVPFEIPLPCFVVQGDGTGIHSLQHPFKLKYPNSISGNAVEILDDDAVSAILRLRQARRLRTSLLYDAMFRDYAVVALTGHLKAMEMGHLIYEGAMLWKRHDVMKTIDTMFSLAGDQPRFTSIREIAEDRYVFDITSVDKHALDAANCLLSEGSREKLFDFLYKKPGMGVAEGAEKVLSGEPDYPSFAYYTAMIDMILFHIHPESECIELKSMQN
ncbi:hypothetical protein GF318_03365 [Candidatus Micrarchaeota archaeon]|nr:hypothetical protein [Candidatus Micrarchaeota archaeon]